MDFFKSLYLGRNADSEGWVAFFSKSRKYDKRPLTPPLVSFPSPSHRYTFDAWK